VILIDSDLARVKAVCNMVLTSNSKIRHVGYYDSFGKVLCDSARDASVSLEGEGIEEMHILNGTAASTLALWKRSVFLLGHMDALVMITEKVVDLIVPRKDDSYYLVVFDAGTSVTIVGEARLKIFELER